MNSVNPTTIIIIGGGIAATACIQSLYQSLESWSENSMATLNVLLISPKLSIKLADNLKFIGRRMESFHVVESKAQQFLEAKPNGLKVEFIHGTVLHIDVNKSSLIYIPNDATLNHQTSVIYNKLCICTGAKPNNLPFNIIDKRLEPHIIKIRDFESVQYLQTKLKSVRKIAIVGNGGIGLETVFKISNCHKTWIIKDNSIGSTFFDAGAAKFLLDAYLDQKKKPTDSSIKHKTSVTSSKYDEFCGPTRLQGCSLGPNWSRNLPLEGSIDSFIEHDLNLIYEDEIVSINFNDLNTSKVELKTGKNITVDCDLVILALGVNPNTDISDSIEMSKSEHGILIDTCMRSSIPNIYAAGDVVSCDNWPINDNLWFQMRLWTQARQMGFYAAKCIVADLENNDPSLYFNFDCFTHVTEFFDKKVVLLGKFKLPEADHTSREILLRINPPDDYIKLIMDKETGNITGAILVGESGLEETIENLILDKIDVRNFKERLLDNSIDVEDYFD